MQRRVKNVSIAKVYERSIYAECDRASVTYRTANRDRKRVVTGSRRRWHGDGNIEHAYRPGRHARTNDADTAAADRSRYKLLRADRRACGRRGSIDDRRREDALSR